MEGILMEAIIFVVVSSLDFDSNGVLFFNSPCMLYTDPLFFYYWLLKGLSSIYKAEETDYL
jgi:hypothetical protein